MSFSFLEGLVSFSEMYILSYNDIFQYFAKMFGALLTETFPDNFALSRGLLRIRQ